MDLLQQLFLQLVQLEGEGVNFLVELSNFPSQERQPLAVILENQSMFRQEVTLLLHLPINVGTPVVQTGVGFFLGGGGSAGTAASIDPTRRDLMVEGVRGLDGVRGDLYGANRI